MSRILVIAEHDHGALKLATGSAVGCARQIAAESGGDFDVLVLGTDVHGVAEAASHWGAASVLVADAPALGEPRADVYARIIAGVARTRGSALLVAAASTFSKDIIPRAAGLLDAAMASDVIGVRLEEGELVFRRVMFAGNVVAAVKLAGAVRAITVRGAAFEAPERSAAPSPVIDLALDPAASSSLIRLIGREEKSTGRPDPTEARVVVAGGRALRNSGDFDRLVGGLADTLGGAVGSSRALVDSGITPNSLQIGQTGKVVAPELYFAIGISGAIQYLAGMKDAKVIVAINKDADAPIFEVADYGLVADVYAAVPELIEKLKAQ